MEKVSKANPNYIFLKKSIKNKRVSLLQGGTRSGKTFSVIYFIIELCEHYKGLEIDIVRDTFTALKATVWKDFEGVLKESRLYNSDNHNKTDHIYYLNGNTISYYGSDTPDKIHGRSRDILWINEAHQFDAEIISQLFPRTRSRIICDYNPALGIDHWLDTYIEKYPPLITTYKDNPHLTKEQVADIESRKNDKYWWAVYGSGIRAVREGIIFTNWKVGNFNNDLPYCYGQDYGFAKDPTTLIKLAVDENTKHIYVHELIYDSTGLGTKEIAQMNKSKLDKYNDLIVADSAELRLISDLQREGLNMLPCEKGQGSVIAGITAMLDYTIIVTNESINIQKELSNYIWNDKKAGIPIDDNNHAIDAMRYAFRKLCKHKSFLDQFL